jgi:ribosome-binding protein aMBF1 (putative translation factor)
VTLTFRNITTDPASPVVGWPTEAVLTALERGRLGDWRRLAAEIRREPWGRTARQVEEVLSHTRPYGVAEAMEEVIARARARAEAAERSEVAREVREAIARSGLTSTEFAAHIGTSRSRLSTYASGRVVPSAALMVRIRRVAELVSPSA